MSKNTHSCQDGRPAETDGTIPMGAALCAGLIGPYSTHSQLNCERALQACSNGTIDHQSTDPHCKDYDSISENTTT